MTTSRHLLLALVATTAASAVAQEPVLPVADPEALFVADDPALHANKQLALHFMRELLQCHHWERAPEWLSERYIQHNPNGRSGRAGIMAFFTRTRQRTETCGKLTSPVVAVIADDDIVTVLMPREYPHPAKPGETYTSTWFYAWRVVDGKLDEHWAPGTIAPP
jgi:predicted SnoaL-like aldol condensation-catalyzing enzyme